VKGGNGLWGQEWKRKIEGVRKEGRGKNKRVKGKGL